MNLNDTNIQFGWNPGNYLGTAIMLKSLGREEEQMRSLLDLQKNSTKKSSRKHTNTTPNMQMIKKQNQKKNPKKKVTKKSEITKMIMDMIHTNITKKVEQNMIGL